MTDTGNETALTPRRSGLTRRQKRALSRGAQYLIFVAAVVALAVGADWGRLQNQFAQVDLAKQLFPDIITLALKNTVLYTLSGFVVGLVLGMVIALMRLSSVGPYRWVSGIYIEIFRGLPALLIFIFVGVAVPLAFPGTEIPGGTYGKVAIALGLVSAAYMAETIRAGIQAVPKGQMEAARSLGFSHARAMISVVIPQAFRIVIPPLTNELVLLFKDSSLVLFLGVTLEERELAKFGRDLASQTANSTPILVAGLCYLLVTVPLGFVVRRLEAKAGEATK
ncbi:amino acid ABC transporter permease [Streptomyces griseoaurantiacus]|jgi:polar amino acid transport system permease protein|uniref:Amino acid ABC transporter membrane protein, PAAT family n=1 Tax=Streptomyces griseoaurantiacus TaxID=68213 RepID=A0A1G7V3R4_9ACTN|nr:MULTISPECIES: amino acid ABC transporter permease [Streptomyces]MCF0087525.1 putative glutamine ABC transporter permease protein GlnM [Streptomyces sp. MH192]MCF0099749.1 putative glutamine ABC transporter permease protein GlnM [Streptomyces sp. MH191]MDX3360394.1 amino acid ABC transporter permease [Streptomyces sp. ME02-6978.2a]SDG54413.1 amino acid ABC transporter membrane protein, PAAT family [Streptomyces jietaisiensis]